MYKFRNLTASNQCQMQQSMISQLFYQSTAMNIEQFSQVETTMANQKDRATGPTSLSITLSLWQKSPTVDEHERATTWATINNKAFRECRPLETGLTMHDVSSYPISGFPVMTSRLQYMPYNSRLIHCIYAGIFAILKSENKFLDMDPNNPKM